MAGALRYKLAAAQMKHYPDDATGLQQPTCARYSVNKPPRCKGLSAAKCRAMVRWLSIRKRKVRSPKPFSER
jgi:hypothetical protein